MALRRRRWFFRLVSQGSRGSSVAYLQYSLGVLMFRVGLQASCRLVRFEVFTAASMKMAVSCVIAPCSLAEICQRFRGLFCLYHQADETVRYSKQTPIGFGAVLLSCLVFELQEPSLPGIEPTAFLQSSDTSMFSSRIQGISMPSLVHIGYFFSSYKLTWKYTYVQFQLCM
jgi:hypothetical protein